MNNKKIWRKNHPQGNFYVLGDSLCDIGALVGGGSALFKHFKIPRVITMPPPFYHNSFSNGKIAVQIIADYFNLTLTPAWKFDFFGLGDEKIGNNYAVGGAAAATNDNLNINAFLMNHFTITKQTDALLSQHTLQENDIIFIAFGGNDIFNAIKKEQPAEQNTVLTQAISNINDSLQKLIKQGASNIIIVNCPDLSCVPLFKNNAKNKMTAWQLSKTFNEKLQKIITTHRTVQNNIILFDLFHCMQQAIKIFQNQNPNNNITDGATITDFRELIITGKIIPHFNEGVTPQNIDNYFFFDDIHANHWAHNFIATEIIKLMINSTKI